MLILALLLLLTLAGCLINRSVRAVQRQKWTVRSGAFYPTEPHAEERTR